MSNSLLLQTINESAKQNETSKKKKKKNRTEEVTKKGEGEGKGDKYCLIVCILSRDFFFFGDRSDVINKAAE